MILKSLLRVKAFAHENDLIVSTDVGAGARWMKGKAIIEYSNGEISVAEIHWFEANGIGQRDHKAVRDLERLT